MKKSLLVVLLLGLVVLGMVTGCDSKKQAEKDLQETIDKYGSVSKETVELLVAKFNAEVMENSGEELNPASDDYLTINSGKYWYGLIEGIYLVIVPEKCSNDKTKDVVDYMTIYVEKGGTYEDQAVKYAKYLVKANNVDLTGEEADKLLEEAKQKTEDKENVNNGKGISVGYLDNADNYQYQVKRLYE